MRPIVMRTRYGCRRLARRWARATSFSCSRHRGGSGSGTWPSPMISSSTRSSRPSLLPTCQYSDAAPAPSSSASRRMLSAARPSRSSSRMAAATIASRLIGSRRRRVCRSGSRCQGGRGICGSAPDDPEEPDAAVLPAAPLPAAALPAAALPAAALPAAALPAAALPAAALPAAALAAGFAVIRTSLVRRAPSRHSLTSRALFNTVPSIEHRLTGSPVDDRTSF